MIYDFCIIGSGPAGLTLCSELSDSNKKICVVESGVFEKSIYADSLKEVRSEGNIEIKYNSRERIVGGTSTTWFGISAPLDPIDMETWPISMDELKPYYNKAHNYGFPKFEEFKINTTLGSNKITEKVFVYPKRAWDFGKKLKHLFSNKNVTLFTDSTVTHISNNSIEICNSKKERNNIEAKIFILAAGGIENTRLLLLSNIGNEYDQVGRYITNHPKGSFGKIILNKKTHNLGFLFGQTRDKQTKYAGLRVNERLQKSFGIMNSYVRLEPIFSSLYSRAMHRIFPNKAYGVKEVKIRNFMDMEVRTENRIVLSNELDIYGNKKARVILNVSERDKRSVTELHKILKDELKNVGELKSDLEKEKTWPINIDASHHLGGTIMGDDPTKSVVDKNLKVHSMDNLYVCGSSVFPTAGNANPTYTICALAIRLADYLKTLE